VLLDGTDPISAARVGGYIGAIVQASHTTPILQRSADPHLARAGPIDLRQRFWFNATLDDLGFFMSVFAAVLLTNLCLSATSLALTGEREDGTYEQMLALPTAPVEIVLGKLVPYVVLCYVDVLLAIIPPGLLYDLWPKGSLLVICIVTLPFILATMGVGVFVSSLARDTAQSVFISVFFILPSFVLSGLMMPYRLMPDGIRQLGGVLPTRWYQLALRAIYSRGAGLIDVAFPFLVLSLMFAIILTAIAWRMKPRLA
jgi:drug efflux transport system permease protein